MSLIFCSPFPFPGSPALGMGVKLRANSTASVCLWTWSPPPTPQRASYQLSLTSMARVSVLPWWCLPRWVVLLVLVMKQPERDGWESELRDWVNREKKHFFLFKSVVFVAFFGGSLLILFRLISWLKLLFSQIKKIKFFCVYDRFDSIRNCYEFKQRSTSGCAFTRKESAFRWLGVNSALSQRCIMDYFPIALKLFVLSWLLLFFLIVSNCFQFC